jgi:hypothetical protein
MVLRIGIENGVEGRSLAWALEYHGCFAYGIDEHEALHRMPAAFQEYVYWIAQHDSQPWVTPVDQTVQVDETWEVYFIDDGYELAAEGYEVNAWFLHDWKPLTEEDVARGLKLLAWTRAELLGAVEGLDQETLDHTQPGERWSVYGILKHVGGAEWWYLDRLGLAFPRAEIPEDPWDRLAKVRTFMESTLPGLVGSRLVIGTDGEFWSPRKMLRRAVWHERDHTFHIRKLLAS